MTTNLPTPRRYPPLHPLPPPAVGGGEGKGEGDTFGTWLQKKDLTNWQEPL